MSLPKFDPWRASISPAPRAYRAYCAYSRPLIGSSGTIGTGQPFIWGEDGALKSACQACRCDAQASCEDTSANPDVARRAALNSGPWLPRLVALGWREHDLFGYSSSGKVTAGLVQMLADSRILVATATAAYLETKAGKRITCRRTSVSGDISMDQSR